MHVLDNAEAVCTIDQSNILGLAVQFPEHIKDAITCGNNVDISKEYGTQVQNIVFSGMGGSAIGKPRLSVTPLCQSQYAPDRFKLFR